MKKKKIKTIKNKCDKLWSELVKLLARGKCEVCATTQTLNSHHVVSRSNHLLRFDPANGCCLCVKHHVFGNESAHKDPQWFIEWFAVKRPEDYQHIREMKKEPPAPLQIKDYERIVETLKKEILVIENC